jgi:hypothetical protein
MLRHLTLAAILLLYSASAQAHYIWLERDGAVARAYYGEWSDDVRERTGGLLDRILAPEAYHASREAKLTVARREDHLEIALAGASDVRLVVDALNPYADKQNGGKTRPMLHARTGRAETEGKLMLEFVPVAPNSSTFALLLRNAPLPKVEVTVYGPPKWSKALHTDEQGRINVPTPWAGRYIIEVVHFEAQPGGSGDGAYERIRHVSTISFETTTGIAWPAQ